MAKRLGKKTIEIQCKPKIIASAAVVGKAEGEGPLAKEFDKIFDDATLGEDSWEKAESKLLSTAVKRAISKAGLDESKIDAVFSGDLLDQCISSAFAIRDFHVPFCGLYGACSTMALSLVSACLALESGGFENVVAATSSHFCSAEKQFRQPLEYGGQRPPTAQRTVTGSGAAVLAKSAKKLAYVDKVHLGTICDYDITDANNMGAAMAPAAAKTICDFLSDTSSKPGDFDLILTGDLGSVGSTLLKELAIKEYGVDLSGVHNDCGLLIFDREKQDVHSGGSGCGCSASVLCSLILSKINGGKLGRVLFAATGALMSPVSSLQGESIPGICHAVELRI